MYGIRKARTKPSSTAIRGLLGSEASTDAVLALLGDTKVGTIKEGILNKIKCVQTFSFLFLLPFLSFFPFLVDTLFWHYYALVLWDAP